MGQGQGKDERGKPRGPVKAQAQASRGVRSAGYSDALVTPTAPPVGGQHPSTAGGGSTEAPVTPKSATSPTAPASGNTPAQQQGASTHSLPRQESVESEKLGAADDGSSATEVMKIVPVVVRYRDPGRIKSLLETKPQVILAAEYDNWRPTIPMCPSEDSYYCIAHLPVGTQRVRFVINGEPFLDASQPTASEGVPANLVVVSDVLLDSRDDDDVAADDGRDWGQEEITFEETRKYPPMLPPHLRYTPLNTPPTQVRCAPDGIMNIAQDHMVLDPEHLPLPLSVTINHVYLQRRDDHTVLGVTTRYGNKFTTVVYYKSVACPTATTST